jgi:glutamate--cysteine ligase
MIPQLNSSLAKPLADLEARVLASSTTIEHWFRQQWQDHTPPFYGSVDLRNSGFKLAQVDMNLYPGGFNNLNMAFQPLCVQAVMSAIDKICPDAKNLLLIPENHTRNTFYLRNVARLQLIMRQAGLNVRIGTLNPEITAPTMVEVPDDQPLKVEPLVRSGNRVGLADFDPCTILLNNDLSSGLPEILKNVHEQFVLPPLHAGWAVRRKTKHFTFYDRVVDEFAKLLEIDPWLLNPYFAQCGQVNFHERSGEECLAANVSAVLDEIREKYLEYGIKEEPFVVVKADAGTYGMGIMTAKSADDVIALNRKQRNKMAVGKEGVQVHEVIIQEGVHTIERVNGGAAEPVIYMIDRFVVGGFYRVNGERAINENLNAPGMTFEQLGADESYTTPDHFAQPSAKVNRFYTYGVVARLALLAASIELEETAPPEA